MNGHYTLFPVPLGVFLNSINYWRYPKPKSIRRYIDIIWAMLGLHRLKRKMRQNELKINCLTLYNENKVK